MRSIFFLLLSAVFLFVGCSENPTYDLALNKKEYELQYNSSKTEVSNGYITVFFEYKGNIDNYSNLKYISSENESLKSYPLFYLDALKKDGTLMNYNAYFPNREYYGINIGMSESTRIAVGKDFILFEVLYSLDTGYEKLSESELKNELDFLYYLNVNSVKFNLYY